MPIFTKLAARTVRRRRAQADQVWRRATRDQAAEYHGAVERILAQARSVP